MYTRYDHNLVQIKVQAVCEQVDGTFFGKENMFRVTHVTVLGVKMRGVLGFIEKKKIYK